LEDVPLLVNHFLQKQASSGGGEPKKIDPVAVDILCHYSYPGNVRELENAIERACALCEEDMILQSDLPPHILQEAQGEKANSALAAMPVGEPLDDFIQQQERNYIEATLAHCGGSREKAASILDISMATLYRKLEPKSKSKAS
jgi:two-component system response regulator HydG